MARSAARSVRQTFSATSGSASCRGCRPPPCRLARRHESHADRLARANACGRRDSVGTASSPSSGPRDRHSSSGFANSSENLAIRHFCLDSRARRSSRLPNRQQPSVNELARPGDVRRLGTRVASHAIVNPTNIRAQQTHMTTPAATHESAGAHRRSLREVRVARRRRGRDAYIPELAKADPDRFGREPRSPPTAAFSRPATATTGSRSNRSPSRFTFAASRSRNWATKVGTLRRCRAQRRRLQLHRAAARNQPPVQPDDQQRRDCSDGAAPRAPRRRSTIDCIARPAEHAGWTDVSTIDEDVYAVGTADRHIATGRSRISC